MGLARFVAVRKVMIVVFVGSLALTASACASDSTTQQAAPMSRSTAATATTMGARLARPVAFTRRRYDFVDTTRPAGRKGDAWFAPQRALPTDVYLPEVAGRRPLIVLAHGQDGGPDRFTQLLSTWARAGYVVAAPRFPVSSDTGPGMAGIADYRQQPADLSFVITRLLDSDAASHIDAHHIGAAGLSLGGGTMYGLVDDPCCRDRRVTAAAVFDGFRPPFPKPYVPNKIPILIVHGDHDPVLGYGAAVKSYRDSASPKWFVTLIGGLHSFAFENVPSPHDKIVEKFTTDYWDATLLSDPLAIARMTRHATNADLSTVVGKP